LCSRGRYCKFHKVPTGKTFPRVTPMILARASICSKHVCQQRVPYNMLRKSVFLVNHLRHPDAGIPLGGLYCTSINCARSHFVQALQSTINDPGSRSHRVACPMFYVQHLFFLVGAKRFPYFARKVLHVDAMRKYHA